MLDAKLLPPGMNRKLLAGFAAEVDGRETVLRAMIARYERRYGSLADLEARLDKGEGSEHPDWEDSIEWRNAEAILRRAQNMRSLLEWLQGSTKQLPNSLRVVGTLYPFKT